MIDPWTYPTDRYYYNWWEGPVPPGLVDVSNQLKPRRPT